MSHWVCVCVYNRFVLLHGVDNLPDLFQEVMGDDYVEHHIVECGSNEVLDDASFYVFVSCRDPWAHVEDFYNNRYIRGVLNSYSDIQVIPPEEIFATKKKSSSFIDDDSYRVNRTDFFLSGDVIKVKTGAFAGMQGVVIGEHLTSGHEFYNVMFRLFVRDFTHAVHIDNLEFVSSVFKHCRFPVTTHSKNTAYRISRFISRFGGLVKRSLSQRLVAQTRFVPLPIDVCEMLYETCDACLLLK